MLNCRSLYVFCLLLFACTAKAQKQEGYITTGAEKLHYLALGTPGVGKPTLLFIHGSPGNLKDLAPVYTDSALTSKYYVIAVDRGGYGGTTPHAPVRSLEEQCRLISPIFQLVKGPLVVIGHSYGGPVALQMAIQYPKQVSALVLVAGAADPAMEKMEWYQKVARWPILKSIVPYELYVCNEEIIPLKHELQVMQPKLATIRIPVAIMQGSKDPLVPPENADYLTRELTNAKWYAFRYPGLNHFIPFRQPKLVCQTVEFILRKLNPDLPANVDKRTGEVTGPSFINPQSISQPHVVLNSN